MFCHWDFLKEIYISEKELMSRKEYQKFWFPIATSSDREPRVIGSIVKGTWQERCWDRNPQLQCSQKLKNILCYLIVRWKSSRLGVRMDSYFHFFLPNLLGDFVNTLVSRVCFLLKKEFVLVKSLKALSSFIVPFHRNKMMIMMMTTSITNRI